MKALLFISVLFISCGTIETNYDPETKNIIYQKKTNSGKVCYEKFYNNEGRLLSTERNVELDTIKLFDKSMLIEIVDVVVTCTEITYHSNGKVKSKGNYLKGKKVGLWRYYRTDGKLDRKEFHDQ